MFFGLVEAMLSNNLVIEDIVVHDERSRIWSGIEKLYRQSHESHTPIYQEAIYEYLRTLVWPASDNPPKRFRDRSNGE